MKELKQAAKEAWPTVRASLAILAAYILVVAAFHAHKANGGDIRLKMQFPIQLADEDRTNAAQ